jgi:creatinine amidohydrolase
MTMATYELLNMPSDRVREVIERMPVAVIPFGSVEQHGKHLPCGTDVFAVEVVAKALADKLGCLFVPFGPYGITYPHARLPGAISLSRSTFEALIADIVTELMRSGVKLFIMVNWHEAHQPSINATCMELQFKHGVKFVVAQAHLVAQRIYAPAGGRLTHAGSIETLAVMAHDADLYLPDRVIPPRRTEKAEALDAMRRSHEIYGYVTNILELSQDGWYGDPTWATAERAKDFAETISSEIARRLDDVWQTLGVDRPNPMLAKSA